jgi:uncharacterized protein YqjF (DUF2071 family)
VARSDLIDAPARQVRSLQELAHRPWPLPARGWTMGQTWDDLLFAHWPVPVATLREHVPAGLQVEEHDGTGWLGITPFVITGFRLRGTLPLPGLSSFPELNVRTYVTADGKPGIWFFSLDTSSRLAVEGARRAYRLPYFQARQSVSRGREIEFRSERGESVFDARYRPTGAVDPARTGSLEHFLVERYCLYAADGDDLFRAEIHHPRWPLQAAAAEIAENTMPPPGIELPDDAPLLHFSRRQDVVIWRLAPIVTRT